MKALDVIVARSLVGGLRQREGLPSLPSELNDFVTADAPFEQSLLNAAAACTLYATCGVTAVPTKERFAASLPDVMRECSPRAASVLEQLLESNLETTLLEWLEAAANARQRVPHRLLPDLLDRAVERRKLRDSVHRVIDNRGAWLAKQNPKWRFVEAELATEDATSAWQIGTRDERLTALRRLRESDSAYARQCVQDTWSADPAEDRIRWLTILADRLAMEDESFLESCLDDRSSRVREAAVDLLARLPASRLVARMTERVEKLFVFKPGQGGSLLKLKTKQPASLTVALPETFDKAMLRDGLMEKPQVKIGPKQWWLCQMIACVPPKFWSKRFETSPLDLISALETDFADAVMTGWRKAVARHPDTSWATALAQSSAGLNRWTVESIAPVPEADRANLISGFPVDNASADDLGQILNAWSPLSAAVSHAVIVRFPAEHLLQAGAATRLHPDVLPELEPGLIDLSTKPYIGRMATEAQTAITLRRIIATEFSE